MSNVLIIDDDKGMCYTLAGMVKYMGHEADCAHTLKDGRDKVFSGSFDVVFLDVMMPDGSGLEVLPVIRKAPSSPEVIIITAVGDPDGAELAVKSGAWDYIEKPYSIKEMTLPFIRALQYREEKAKKKAVALKKGGIIGSGPGMKECLDLLAQAANSEANVLLTGETGTGKELFARAIHENSLRRDKNFVVVDCTTLPETLVESVLFGHEKGAFTGADRTQDGLIKQADGGTLFLDEVGELPLTIQKGFLRALQERRFRAVGAKQETMSEFRLVAATHRDLDEMVRRGEFRKDLLFRLRSFTLHLPPLKDRKEDIKALSMHHVARLSEQYETGTKGFSPEFFHALEAYTWPGNVRELFNALERALASAQDEPTLFPYHLPLDIRVQITRNSVDSGKSEMHEPLLRSDFSERLPTFKDFREDGEKRYLQALIGSTKSDIKAACRISGLSRSRLYALLKKNQITDFQ
jgi:two-component system NtrC family response regulator